MLSATTQGNVATVATMLFDRRLRGRCRRLEKSDRMCMEWCGCPRLGVDGVNVSTWKIVGRFLCRSCLVWLKFVAAGSNQHCPGVLICDCPTWYSLLLYPVWPGTFFGTVQSCCCRLWLQHGSFSTIGRPSCRGLM